jgi:hypothetical protein
MLIWQGISQLDNRTPIRLILTIGSRNRKTGRMLQTWILRSRAEPHKAVQSGKDQAVCGSCPFRAGNGCYVAVHQAPLSTYRAHKKAKVATVREIARHRGKALRIGSYGDPAAVPLDVWEALIGIIQPPRRTGYSHAWKTAPKGFARLVMASVDSLAEQAKARELGYRTFRVAPKGELAIASGEIRCVNDSHGVSCIDCGLCDGARPNDRRRSIVIPAHGAKASRIGVAIRAKEATPCS